MDRILLEAARKIETGTDIDRVWSVIIEAMQQYEIPYVIYITNSDTPPSNWHVHSTLPNNWPEPETTSPSFKEPFLVYCCATYEITKMGIEFISDHDGYVDDTTFAYVQKIEQLGWKSALGIPCSLVGSGRHGGFIVGNSMDRYTFERSILPKADMFQTFCLIAHKKLEVLHFKLEAKQKHKPLSPREFQSLNLLAKGLRPKQISAELEISEASIRLYLKNARTKLGASTKEEAIVLFMQQQIKMRT